MFIKYSPSPYPLRLAERGEIKERDFPEGIPSERVRLVRFMKAQIINTDFLHDGKYYIQNSIIDLPPDLIKKYPSNLVAVDLFSNDKKDNVSAVDDSIEMIQDNSNSDKMIDPKQNKKLVLSRSSKRVEEAAKDQKLNKGKRS